MDAQEGESFFVRVCLVDSVAQEGIPYATVSAARVETPEVYVKRLASGIDGDFELALDSAGAYVVTFESVGMNTVMREVRVSIEQKRIELGDIMMSESKELLDEVSVVAQKPLVKTDLDKIIYDMESDPDSKTSTTLDMLRKVPLVTVDGEDNIQVKGSSDFKVFINGKPSKMMEKDPQQILKGMPASTIKNIELITEPGVKYDAEGIGGIINIVTTKALVGYSGSVNAGASSNGEYSGGAYITSKIGKFGVSANLNYYRRDRIFPTISVSERENLGDVGMKYVKERYETNDVFNMGHGNLDLSYEFDSLNLLSLTVGGRLGAYGGDRMNETMMMNANKDTLSSYVMESENSGTWGGMNMSLDYQRSFAKKDKLLTLSYQWGRRPDNSTNMTDVTNAMNYPIYTQRTRSRASGDEHTLQVDYTEPFNKIHVLEAGAKYILRINRSDNTYERFDSVTDLWQPMRGLDDTDLRHRQHIASGYASYALKLKKFSIRAGARVEHTNQHVTMDTTFNVNFTNVIPSATISYRPKMGHDVRLSYNQRIRRPGIWHLNPFYDDSNPLSVRQGNPELEAPVSHSLALNYTYYAQKVSLNLSAFGGVTNNGIQSVSTLINDSVVYTTYDNVGKIYRTGGSAYVNWMVSKAVRLYASTNVEYVDYASEIATSRGWSGSVHAGGNANLPWKLKLGGYGGYMSPRVQMQGKNGAYYYYGLSLSRAFVKDKLNIAIKANNFAEKRQENWSMMETEYYKSYTKQSWAAMGFGVQVSYRFGEMKEQIKKAKRGIQNDDVMNNGGGGSGTTGSGAGGGQN